MLKRTLSARLTATATIALLVFSFTVTPLQAPPTRAATTELMPGGTIEDFSTYDADFDPSAPWTLEGSPVIADLGGSHGQVAQLQSVLLPGETDDAMTVNVDTTGYSYIVLSYDRMTEPVENDNNEQFTSQFQVDVAGFTTLETLESTSGWLTRTYALPVTSWDTTGLDIRFAISGLSDDVAYVDNVSVTGIPITRNQPNIACSETVDIMLTLDRSNSMNTNGRLPAAKAAAQSFVNILDGSDADGTLNGYQTGLVTFATDATVDHNLTTDAASLNAAIEAITAADRTNLYAALTTADSALGSGPNKVLILLSDGEANEPPPSASAAQRAVDAANTIKAAGTAIYTIGLNIPSGSYAETTLRSIASQDSYYSTGTTANLEEVFSTIAYHICPPADLVLTKTVDRETVVPGGTLTYTVTLANRGSGGLSGLVLSDRVPTDTTLDADSFTPRQPDAMDGLDFSWNLDIGPSPATASFSYSVTVDTPLDEGAVIENTATLGCAAIASDDLLYPLCDASINATASASVTVAAEPLPMLNITKTADTATAALGETVLYTVTLRNTGTADADALILTDTLPNGLTFLEDGEPLEGLSREWTWPALPVGAQVSVIYEVQVDADAAAGDYQNVAVANATGLEPVSASATIAVGGDSILDPYELVISKQVSREWANPGDTVSYTVVVTNLGPDPANDITVTDVLPEGLLFADTGDRDRVWTIGTLAADESLTFTYDVLIPETTGAGIYGNVVTATVEPIDPVSATANLEVRLPTVLGTTDTQDELPVTGGSIGLTLGLGAYAVYDLLRRKRQ